MVECNLGHSKPAFWLFHRSQAFAGAQVGVDRDKKARFVQSAASQINLSKVHFISRGFICARVAVLTPAKNGARPGYLPREIYKRTDWPDAL
jgi:hypothetical protein